MKKELSPSQQTRNKSNKNKMPIAKNFPLNKFVGRWALLGALTYSALFGGIVHNTESVGKSTKEAIVKVVDGLEGKSELPSDPKNIVAKEVTVGDGYTAWQIATKEGPAVANYPENMYNAVNNILDQAKVEGLASGATGLVPGEVIVVPGYSDEGTPVYVNDPQAKKDESILKNG